jgi:hypothetical protein
MNQMRHSRALRLLMAQKTLCDPKNLCNDSLEFNKCKGGDPVSRKVLERGVGTAWEVSR